MSQFSSTLTDSHILLKSLSSLVPVWSGRLNQGVNRCLQPSTVLISFSFEPNVYGLSDVYGLVKNDSFCALRNVYVCYSRLVNAFLSFWASIL